MEEKKKPNPASFVIALVVLAGAGWYFMGGGMQAQTANTMQGIHNQVTADAVAQYAITARGTSAMDMCVHAGIVAASYLQAKDEAAYKQWKETEKADCELAGVPR